MRRDTNYRRSAPTRCGRSARLSATRWHGTPVSGAVGEHGDDLRAEGIAPLVRHSREVRPQLAARTCTDDLSGTPAELMSETVSRTISDGAFGASDIWRRPAGRGRYRGRLILPSSASRG